MLEILKELKFKMEALKTKDISTKSYNDGVQDCINLLVKEIDIEEDNWLSDPYV